MPDSPTPPSADAAAEPLFPMPTPRAVAVAVLALLGFGAMLGTAVGPVAPSDASAPLIVAVVPRPGPIDAPAPPPAAGDAATPDAAGVPGVSASAPPDAGSGGTAAPSSTGGGAATPVPVDGGAALPPVKHVFLIVLSGHGYDDAFGPNAKDAYLATTLRRRGELVQDYSAVAPSALADGVALISGQDATAEMASDCPQYDEGCLFPSTTQMLADQLTSDGRTWKAYIEDVGNGASEPATCRHPAIGTADPDQQPRDGDAYVTWRNPFVYFHSLVDGTACASNDVGLDHLDFDLTSETTTPTLSYIVPNRCHDGSDTPCGDGQPSGLAASDAFLKTVVPRIEASAAYRAGGLVAITFDTAPASDGGAQPSSPAPASTAAPASTTAPASTAAPAPTDPSAAAPAPTLADGAAPPAGPQVGLLLLSPYVKAGSVEMADAYTHFSLLRSIEDLFDLPHLGHAADPSVAAFDRVVYNAWPPKPASSS